MKRAGYMVLLASAALLVLAVTQAAGYDRYHPAAANDGCFQCHPSFAARDVLHDVHEASGLVGSCRLCHTTNGDNPYTWKSGDDPNHSCNGCHVGPGLRKHHLNAGAPADGAGRHCNAAGCHPSDPVPVGENVLPPYYSRTDVLVHKPCLWDPAKGGENWDGSVPPGLPKGLDNDGDLIYDAADPNCIGVLDAAWTAPSDFDFASPYPNPAKGGVTLDLTVPRAVVVKIVVYDQAGRAVRTIADREFVAGRHSLVWDTRDDKGNPVRSGVYFVSYRTPDMATMRTTVFIR